MTFKAIDILSKNDKGFFLFVASGSIDRAHHETRAHDVQSETFEFSEAIEQVLLDLNHGETLTIVTADHSHTLSYAGYGVRSSWSIMCSIDICIHFHLSPQISQLFHILLTWFQLRGSNLFGIAGKSELDHLPYLKISYANGPGFYSHRQSSGRADPLKKRLQNIDLVLPSTVPMSSETHGGDDVAVFAIGPYAHLFRGVFEQNVIPHIVAYAACIGDELKHC